MHAAIPLGLSPELVHLLRVNLVPQAPFIAEADLLLSPLCVEAGGGLYEMDPGVRGLLLDELASDDDLGPRRLLYIATFLAAYVERAIERTNDPDVRAFLRVQQWTALARLEPEQAGREIRAAFEAAEARHDRAAQRRLVRLTDALSAPLAGDRALTGYAAGLGLLLGGHIESADLPGVDNSPPVQADHPSESRQHVTAKVVLLGDSGVGKSGLGLALSEQEFQPTVSSHGRTVWNLGAEEVAVPGGGRQTREIMLWDLGGQPDYRLVHQLQLHDVAMVLVLFDASDPIDEFRGVRYWVRTLAQARPAAGGSAPPPRVYLVSARVDRGGLTTSRESIEALVDELALDGFFETSAKSGWGIAELSAAVREGIAWDALPVAFLSAPFGSLWEFLRSERERGRLLVTVDELFRDYRHTFPTGIDGPPREGFEAAMAAVERQGLVRLLPPSDLVLLQPEQFDSYASAIILTVRGHPDGLGLIAEEAAIAGPLRLPDDLRVHDPVEERLLRVAAIEELLRHQIAFQEETDQGVALVFPSLFLKERSDGTDLGREEVYLGFQGPLDQIYATLVVRLSYSRLFRRHALWRNTALFRTTVGAGTCAVQLREQAEGQGELVLSFDRQADATTQARFEAFIADHLEGRALRGTVTRRRVRTCPNCDYTLPDDLVRRRLERGSTTVSCPVCDTPINLVDVLDFDVFLCHNGADSPAVKEIGQRLKDGGILPWLDEWSVRPGVPWQHAIEQQIHRMMSAAVFVGRDGIGPWQRRELDALLRELVERGVPVIPVLLATAPSEPELPLYLQDVAWVDFRRAYPEPFEQLVLAITGQNDRDPSP
jgi:GTPase SAR1 family protein